MTLPGEAAAEPQCFYVPANMVRARDFCRSRPASVDTMNDEVTSMPVVSFQCENNSEDYLISPILTFLSKLLHAKRLA